MARQASRKGAAFGSGRPEGIVAPETADHSAGTCAMLPMLVEQPVVRRTAAQYRTNELLQSAREHRELIAAFAARDSHWARAVMTSHIRRAFHVFSSTAKRRTEQVRAND